MAVFSQGKWCCDKSSTPQQQGNCYRIRSCFLLTVARPRRVCSTWRIGCPGPRSPILLRFVARLPKRRCDLDPKSQLIVRAAGICSIFLAVGGLLRLGGTGWWLIGALALLGLGMILAGLPEIFFGWNRFGRDRFDGGRREGRPFRAGATRKTTGMKRNGPGEIP